MYAIVETGSKQFKVSEGDVIDVELINAEAGKEVALEKVLLYTKDGAVKVGRPYVDGAKVVCEVIGRIRGKKVIAFKYRRRKSSKKKIGHRQRLTRLKIKKIHFDER